MRAARYSVTGKSAETGYRNGTGTTRLHRPRDLNTEVPRLRIATASASEYRDVSIAGRSNGCTNGYSGGVLGQKGTRISIQQDVPRCRQGSRNRDGAAIEFYSTPCRGSGTDGNIRTVRKLNRR